MRLKSLCCIITLAAVLGSAASPSAFAGEEAEKVTTAGDVFKEITVIPEKGIPPELLKNAYGVAIIPGVIKVGFIVGGRHGSGVLLVRGGDGEWSNPVFISITGGGIGWQIGAQSTDVILVFKSRRSIDGIMDGKFTLGVDAAAAAGPVGRSLAAATDEQLKAEIYSYSRSRGLFAGISLEGAALLIEDKANAAFYGRPGIDTDDILAGKGIKATPAVKRLHRLLTDHALAGGK